ncbi:hypothetical protein GCE86_26085 [Micromonospora terminaliae]|uniref:Uncharacterized protein n=1 Tax=Micromonospora terminaliae TaxID=1914461 RepID=A0AAJ2ZAW6_9ACTN|nr:hypothetical protein [Micromonospora terminaliae]NES25974.1 hypothetical protein [Micromonospora terminaliae]QGL50184.1 hypothetical protein GCE86_26085 [Micromonospora terminaliae]
MEITSGGTPGPRLADRLAALDNNLYGRLQQAPKAKILAEMFVRAGWRARASSWNEYEVEHDWVCIELVEPSPDECLFSGVVDPSRVDELGAILAGFGLRYSIELWSADRTSLLRELAG